MHPERHDGGQGERAVPVRIRVERQGLDEGCVHLLDVRVADDRPARDVERSSSRMGNTQSPTTPIVYSVPPMNSSPSAG